MKTKDVKISDEVRDVLMSMTWDRDTAKMPRLDRAMYVKVNEVLNLAGGKWDKKRKAHVFDEQGQEKIAQAIEDGAILDAKKTFQFYETPAEIADKMVANLDYKRGEHVLEPSFGKGALITALYRAHPNITPTDITGVEIQKEMVDYTTGLCYFIPVWKDFLTYTPVFTVDKIIMNPPFSGGQDIDHVTRAWSFLKPGGRLVALTSPSWQFRTSRRHVVFRDSMVSRYGEFEAIPAGAFRQSGTDIRTVMVTLYKPTI